MNTDALLAARGLPANLEAERLLLGLLLSGRTEEQAAIIDGLRPEYLTTEAHRIIIATAARLWNSGRSPDRIVLAQSLIDEGKLEQVHGLTYLMELDSTPRGLNIDGYLSVLREKWVRREAIATAQRITVAAMSGEAEDVTTELERFLSIDASPRRRAQSFAEAMRDISLDDLLTPDSERPEGIAFPWLEFGRIAGVMLPNQMTAIAGPTGGGKSSFARQIAASAAQAGVPTLYFSLEMTFAEMAAAMACAMAEVDSADIRRGRTDMAQRGRFASAIGQLEGMPLWIDDRTNTVTGMDAELRRLIAVHGIRLCIVDHFHLLDLGGMAGSNETSRQEAAANRLRGLAQQLQVHMLVLAQYDKAGAKEQVKDRQPTIYDISGSKALVNASQRVIMLHPERVGLPWPEKLPYLAIVGKNRGGRMGEVPLQFWRRYTKFVEPIDNTETV